MKDFDARAKNFTFDLPKYVCRNENQNMATSLNSVGHMGTISSVYNINNEFAQHTNFEITVAMTPPL